MSDIKLQNVPKAQQANTSHEIVAMVYRNEHNEVSYYESELGVANEIDNGLSSIMLILVLSFVALVTISRRDMVL